MVRYTLAALMCMCVGFAVAEDKKNAPPDMAKMMEAMKKHAEVGEHHKILAKLVGKWDMKGQHFIPGAPPQDMSGSYECKSIMNGLYIADHVKMKATKEMPEGYEGMGFTGYDNHTKKFFYTWIGNESSSAMNATGTYDPAKKALVFDSIGFDCMAGKPCKTRHVITFKSDDEVHESFTRVGDGPDTKMMEMTMKRVK